MNQSVKTQAVSAAYDTIIYERPAPKVARIVVNKPEKRNARTTGCSTS